MVTPCVAQTKAGAPCRAQAATGSVYCLMHDPERSQVISAARKRGGENKAAKRRALRDLADRALTLEEFSGLLGAVALDVFAGKKPPAIANAIASLAKAAAALVDATTNQEELRRLEEAAAIEAARVEAETRR